MGLSVLLPILLLTGCSTIPSRMYTTMTRAGVRAVGDPGPPPCDTFRLGEHPIVVVEGFGGVKEAVLELSTNGVVVTRKTFPIHSGQTDATGTGASTVYRNFDGHWVETVDVYVTAGFEVDLGVFPPGAYDLTLKTNDVLAAAAHFKVTMPAELENERQAIESVRKQLEEARSAMKELRLEIEHEQSVVDHSNANLVSALNTKVDHYNELLKKVDADAASFNARVESYNARLSTYGLKVQ